MNETIAYLPGLPPVGGKELCARFDGGRLSSDGGVLLLREIEGRLGIAELLSEHLMIRTSLHHPASCVQTGNKRRPGLRPMDPFALPYPGLFTVRRERFGERGLNY